jgi:apolipoprotein N-acyltransferase
MTTVESQLGGAYLKMWCGILYAIGAAAAFNLAYSFDTFGFLIAVYLWCLYQLTRLRTARQVSYVGLLAGLLAFAPQLYFFWTLFGPGAIALWAVCAFWIRMFLVVGRACRERFGPKWAAWLIPFIWTGFEYFRSELYYLRFSWLNAGFVFAHRLQWMPITLLGVYGFGFAMMLAIGLLELMRARARRVLLVVALVALATLNNLPSRPMANQTKDAKTVSVAGVQMEFPSESEILLNLRLLARAHPEAQVIVLSEYSIDGPITPKIAAWCRNNTKYLVIGGKAPASNGNYYDTAFVVGPTGEVVFQQAKCVPVQFFKDGLPAKEQKLWDSPWGKIGFCICYDLSYSRVTDELVRQGAEALIVPSMDVVDWGRHQHELHARVAPVIAAEYKLPIFRIGSSGISQCVDRNGRETATAPMPGDGAMLAGVLQLKGAGHLPADRVIAPLSVGVTIALVAWFAIAWLTQKAKRLPGRPLLNPATAG